MKLKQFDHILHAINIPDILDFIFFLCKQSNIKVDEILFSTLH